MKENQQNHLISACGATIPIFGPPLVTIVFDTLSLFLSHPTINAPHLSASDLSPSSSPLNLSLSNSHPTVRYLLAIHAVRS